MPFQISQLHDRGTSTPAIARTSVQSSQIIAFFQVPEENKQAATVLCSGLRDSLIRCLDIADEINSVVEDVRTRIESGELKFSPSDQAHQIPSVINLRSKVESFLQATKLAIRDVGRMAEPFYGVNYDHNLKSLRNWAKSKFGDDHNFVRYCDRWEPFVKHVLAMRDAVDHEKQATKLNEVNFHLEETPTGFTLVGPQWWLEDGAKSAIAKDMNVIIECIVSMHEEIITCLFYEHIGLLPLIIIEIPEAERNPSCPIKFRVTLRQ